MVNKTRLEGDEEDHRSEPAGQQDWWLDLSLFLRFWIGPRGEKKGRDDGDEVEDEIGDEIGINRGSKGDPALGEKVRNEGEDGR